MNPKFYTKDIDKDRTLVINKQTGRETLVVKDQKYREMVNKGELLQPTDPRFFKKYPEWRKRSDGTIYNKRLEDEEREKNEAEEEIKNWKEEVSRRSPSGRKYY